jgi:hypothetical protein
MLTGGAGIRKAPSRALDGFRRRPEDILEGVLDIARRSIRRPNFWASVEPVAKALGPRPNFDPRRDQHAVSAVEAGDWEAVERWLEHALALASDSEKQHGVRS